mmetsp:Transcript_950/g.1254  ORF Transcript_950/g.1254 Transcript_950/m.1254 type:complete len:230 (+) Transcript_950:260-949(+)
MCNFRNFHSCLFEFKYFNDLILDGQVGRRLCNEVPSVERYHLVTSMNIRFPKSDMLLGVKSYFPWWLVSLVDYPLIMPYAGEERKDLACFFSVKTCGTSLVFFLGYFLHFFYMHKQALSCEIHVEILSQLLQVDCTKQQRFRDNNNEQSLRNRVLHCQQFDFCRWLFLSSAYSCLLRRLAKCHKISLPKYLQSSCQALESRADHGKSNFCIQQHPVPAKNQIHSCSIQP